MESPGPSFQIVWLMEYATLICPKSFEFQEEVLKGQEMSTPTKNNSNLDHSRYQKRLAFVKINPRQRKTAGRGNYFNPQVDSFNQRVRSTAGRGQLM